MEDSSKGSVAWNADFEKPKWKRVVEKISSHPTYYILAAMVSGILLFGTGTFLVGTQSSAQRSFDQLPAVPTLPQTSTEFLLPSPTPAGSSVSGNSVKVTTLTPTLTPIPTVNPTATWSAYLSSYGYSIKYPPGWIATPTTSGDPLILEYVLFNPNTIATSSSSITVSYANRSQAQALAVYSANGQAMSIGTISATMQTTQDSNGNVAYRVVIPDGTANSITIFGRVAYQTLFNQMVQTFTFTSATN